MSVEHVKKYLERFGKVAGVMEFAVSSATVELAAEAVGVIPARIAKSLTFQDGDAGCLMIVAAGDARIDNTRFKAAFAMKARMLSAEDVERLTGHPVGGVCPFDLPESGVRVFLDRSMERFDSVYPACGSGNSAIELTLPELFQTAGAVDWVDVCRGWREEPESPAQA